MGGLFRAAPLARHRAEARPMPGVGISTRNTRPPEVRAGATGPGFCHRLAREGIPVTKPLIQDRPI